MAWTKERRDRWERQNERFANNGGFLWRMADCSLMPRFEPGHLFMLTRPDPEALADSVEDGDMILLRLTNRQLRTGTARVQGENVTLWRDEPEGGSVLTPPETILDLCVCHGVIVDLLDPWQDAKLRRHVAEQERRTPAPSSIP